MLDLDTKSDSKHETNHSDGTATSATTGSSSAEPWWETPAGDYVKHGFVDPSLFGLDADDVDAGGVGHRQRRDAVSDLLSGTDVADDSSFPDFDTMDADSSSALLQLDQDDDVSSTHVGAALDSISSQVAGADAHVSDASAFAFLRDGENAVLSLDQGTHRATALYAVIKSQASVKAAHEKIEADYQSASNQRDKMLEVSTLEKVINGVTAVVDFATSLHGLVSAARLLHDAAVVRNLNKKVLAGKATSEEHVRAATLRTRQRGKSKLKAVGDVVSDGGSLGKGVGKAVKATMKTEDPDAKIDADTILANANATAIGEGNAALIDWLRADATMNVVMVHEKGKTGSLDFLHMTEGIALLLNGQAQLSAESFNRYKSIIDRFDEKRLEYIGAVKRVESLLRAYDAGGASGLANAKELGVYETIQQWIEAGDPRARALRFSLDQDSKGIAFDGDVVVDIETGTLGGSNVTDYYCYSYTEHSNQSEDATLYASNGEAAKALRDLGLAYAQPNQKSGLAEGAEDAAKSGVKFTISTSIAKAIQSLGVHGTANNARVQFFHKQGLAGSIEHPHKGAWMENWRSTPEFTSFWKGRLGGQYAFITNGIKRQTILAATSEPDVMARSEVSRSVAAGPI